MTILTAKADLRGATVSSDMLFTVSPWLSPAGFAGGRVCIKEHTTDESGLTMPGVVRRIAVLRFNSTVNSVFGPKTRKFN